MPAPMPTKHAVSLFSCSAVKKLTSQFTDLLDLTVTENDGLPEKHVCTKCVRWLGSLERAVEDLVNFHSQAMESYRALHHIKHEG